jgi:hypothetical protein
MPINDRYVFSGLFRRTQFLGRLYAVGMYQVVYYYSVSGAPMAETDCFEIVGGGGNLGSVVSTYFYDRPEAKFVIQGLESGEILKGRNPSV